MLRRRTFALPRLAFGVVLLAAMAPRLRAQSPRPVVGSSVTPAQQDAPAPRVWMPVFQFRNGFWVNLQHFLYLQARIQRGLSVTGSGRSAPGAWAAENLSGLTPAERGTWQHAVDYYATHFASYSFPYDSFLVRFDDRLSDMGGCPELSSKTMPDCQTGFDPVLTSILEQAAPVYRAHWWPQQKRTNQEWISRASRLVHLYGGKPAQMLALTFDDTWPSDPIPIDVTMYAGAYGAYTTLDPIHVAISSTDSRNQGPLALAVIFRESSHAVAWPVEQSINDECQSQTKAVPRDLWHALAAYTTAKIFERAFGGQLPPDLAGETPAALAASEHAYAASRGWQDYENLLQLFWQPYLDGRVTMDTAIDNLVDAL